VVVITLIISEVDEQALQACSNPQTFVENVGLFIETGYNGFHNIRK
jgi:hypothetical protein